MHHQDRTLMDCNPHVGHKKPVGGGYNKVTNCMKEIGHKKRRGHGQETGFTNPLVAVFAGVTALFTGIFGGHALTATPSAQSAAAVVTMQESSATTSTT